MPQIEQIASTYASQLFWLLLVFGFVYFVIGRGMLPKILDTVDARDKQIENDLAEASRARASADTIEDGWRARMAAARDAAQADLAAAKAQAADATRARVTAADAANNSALLAAESRIATARTGVMASIDDVAADAARDLVAKLTGGSVDPDAARAAVKEVMARG